MNAAMILFNNSFSSYNQFIFYFMLMFWYLATQGVSQTSSIDVIWSMLGRQNLRPCPVLIESKSAFN